MSRSSFRMLVIATLAAAGATPGSAAAPATLAPYVAEYEVLRDGAEAGRAIVTLKAEPPQTWRLHSQTRGTHGLAGLAGLRIEETSVFQITPEGLACVSYQYRQTGLRTRERSVACGSGEDGIVSRDHKGEYRFPAAAGILDRQIVSLALARDLGNGKGEALSYAVVDRERLEPQRYRIAGTEHVAVPAGTFEATRVERVREDDERSTTTWFGVAEGIPLRVLQSERDGEGFEMRLVSLKR